uniref:Uncharacterized protein n=1 Tax=Petromyzon marinus TaxID=7757 RepID=S4RE69_PETMA
MLLLLGQPLSLGDNLLNGPHHVERDFREVIHLTYGDHLEPLDGVRERHQLALVACEHLGHLRGLRQEALDLASAGDRQFVLLRQLVHTQDSDDVLQGLVVLREDLLHATGHLVVLQAHNVGVHDTRGGVEGVHRRVDAQLGDGTRQHGRGVQVSEGGGRGGVGQVVSRHVDGLRGGGDGALLGGGDAFLHGTHVRGERGLVTHGGGDTPKKSRHHLGAGLCEAEDVVDEEQHVLALLVTEILGHREPRQGDTGTGAGRLVHLPVHQRHLQGAASDKSGVLEVDDTGLNHLVVEIVAFARALPDAGKHGVASVRLGHVVDQLHDEHSLPHAGTTEESCATSRRVSG